jgi:hypothetical protein
LISSPSHVFIISSKCSFGFGAGFFNDTSELENLTGKFAANGPLLLEK